MARFKHDHRGGKDACTGCRNEQRVGYRTRDAHVFHLYRSSKRWVVQPGVIDTEWELISVFETAAFAQRKLKEAETNDPFHDYKLVGLTGYQIILITEQKT